MNSTIPADAFAGYPDRNGGPAGNQPDNSIGAILIRNGRLSVLDAEKVMRFSVERNMRFGDAAVEMGVLSVADIELALSRQYDYPYLLAGESAISDEVIAAYEPFTTRVESLRALRNQLMWRWFETGDERRALAITSAESGDGRSFLAANLAVVFSQQRQRTLLIDADLRTPRQHQLFGLENRAGLSGMLAGRSGLDAIQRVPALADLSVMTAGALPPNPSELLGLPAFGRLLRELATNYDVILIDTPAGDAYSDAQLVASRAGAAVMVAHQNHSHLKKMRDLVSLLTDARVHMVGTVLNDY
jgi:receptor protein-tyrosine kinase